MRVYHSATPAIFLNIYFISHHFQYFNLAHYCRSRFAKSFASRLRKSLSNLDPTSPVSPSLDMAPVLRCGESKAVCFHFPHLTRLPFRHSGKFQSCLSITNQLLYPCAHDCRSRRRNMTPSLYAFWISQRRVLPNFSTRITTESISIFLNRLLLRKIRHSMK